MRVTVRLFALLRDRAGINATDVDLPDAATVGALLDVLATKFPSLKASLSSALVAVNQEYAFRDDPLQDGDEIALFPPVSGGSSETSWPEYLAITRDHLDLDAIAAAITRPETGALAIFTGAVRGITKLSEGHLNTDHLLYEAFEPMAEKMLHQVAREIRERYPNVQGIAIVQRIGRLTVGETTVLVGCAAGHRDDGIFEAARYGINRLKEIVPIWKKEMGPDGSLWIEGHYRPTPADVPGRSAHLSHNGLSMALGCLSCGQRYDLATPVLTCKCGGILDIVDAPPFDPQAIDGRLSTMWRYRKLLAPQEVEPVTLGEGWTPLIEIQEGDRAFYLKMEGCNPTGSFKDRGASLLVSILRSRGIQSVHDDSSGNAGAALAAYAARGGLEATLFVPAHASPAKLAQIALYGAHLEAVTGARSAATLAAQQRTTSDRTSYYASHALHPLTLMACKSLAYEIWEQLDRRVPDIVIMPLGHGTQLLGLYGGFRDLHAAGLISHLPRLIGVQARQCAPLWQRFHHEATDTVEGETIAEGIRIADPVRAEQVLNAIRGSKGDILAVEERDILTGLLDLARHGILAEPTSAVVWAAVKQYALVLPRNAMVVLSITGSGLKTPQIERLAGQASV